MELLPELRPEISPTLAQKIANVKETNLNTGGNSQIEFSFTNGYGASVVRGPFTYGGSEGLFELAVVDKDGILDYSTPITDDVIGWLSPEDVVDLLEQIANLSDGMVVAHRSLSRIEKRYREARDALVNLPTEFNVDGIILELDERYVELRAEALAALEQATTTEE